MRQILNRMELDTIRMSLLGTSRNGLLPISTGCRGWWNGIRTIPRLSSGLWEMKPVTGTISLLTINGPKVVMRPARFSTNEPNKARTPLKDILIFTCLLYTSDAADEEDS